MLADLERDNELVASQQVLSELYNVLTKREGQSRSAARRLVDGYRSAYLTPEASAESLSSALDLAVAHQLTIWDAVVLNGAAEANCSLLLSEDLQDGFVWRDTTVVDPFAPVVDARLAALLARAR